MGRMKEGALDRLHQQISEAVAEERLVFSVHADNQLTSRNVEGWQVVTGFQAGRLLRSQPGAQPNPKILVRQELADGTPVVAVWAFVKSLAVAKLVTVYFPDSP